MLNQNPIYKIICFIKRICCFGCGNGCGCGNESYFDIGAPIGNNFGMITGAENIGGNLWVINNNNNNDNNFNPTNNTGYIYYHNVNINININGEKIPSDEIRRLLKDEI